MPASVSRLGLAGSGLALATAALYVALITAEGNDPVREVAPWAAAFVGIGLAAGTAAVVPSARLRAIVFPAAAAVSLVLGLLALASIGSLLVAAGVLLVAAALRP